MKLLQNAIIHAMDSAFSMADGLVWDDERIVAIGKLDELTTRYPEAERIEGHGFTALPGFIDPHIHLLDGVIYQKSLDCSPTAAPTIPGLKNLLRDAAARCPQDHWVVGQGYDPWEYPEKRTPNREDLDEACPDHPAVVFHYSFHECAANSGALELGGINRQTPQPIAGEIVKDRRGEPTGHLIETAMANVRDSSRNSLIQQTKDAVAAVPECCIYHLGHVMDKQLMKAKHEFYLRRDGNDKGRQKRMTAWHNWNGQTGDCGDGLIKAVDWELPEIVRRAYAKIEGATVE